VWTLWRCDYRSRKGLDSPSPPTKRSNFDFPHHFHVSPGILFKPYSSFMSKDLIYKQFWIIDCITDFIWFHIHKSLGQKWWHNHAPFVVQLLRRRQPQPSSLFPHKVNLFVSPNCLPKFS
jgi:hypothetical protein